MYFIIKTAGFIFEAYFKKSTQVDQREESERRIGEMSRVLDRFGSMVFDDKVMRAMLSEDAYRSMRNTINRGDPLNHEIANAVAQAMKGGLKRSYSLYTLVPAAYRHYS